MLAAMPHAAPWNGATSSSSCNDPLAANGHASNGHACNGHASSNGHASNGVDSMAVDEAIIDDRLAAAEPSLPVGGEG